MNRSKNMVEEYPGDVLLESAKEFFCKNSHLNGLDNMPERIIARSFEIGEMYSRKVEGKVIHSVFRDLSFRGNELSIEGQEIEATIFGRVDKDNVRGSCICFSTIGDVAIEAESAVEQLFSHIWENAFLEAIREKFKMNIGRGERVSNSLGPGFFGMAVSDMVKLGNLVNSRDVGIYIDENGTLKPIKSCGEMYFLVGEDYVDLPRGCESCIGDRKNCEFCHLV